MLDAEREVKRRLGWDRLNRMEILVAACLIVFVAGMGVLGWRLWSLARGTNTIVRNQQVSDTRLSEQFMRQEAALRALKLSEDQLKAEVAALRARQPQIIVVHERSPGDTEVIVVTSSPRPQPTATVTCDPTPIIGDPSCRRGPK